MIERALECCLRNHPVATVNHPWRLVNLPLTPFPQAMANLLVAMEELDQYYDDEVTMVTVTRRSGCEVSYRFAAGVTVREDEEDG